MEEAVVGGCNTVPTESVEIGAKIAAVVEALAADVAPSFLIENGAVEFGLPDDLSFVALSIVINTVGSDGVEAGDGFNGGNEPAPGTDTDDVARLRYGDEAGGGGGGKRHGVEGKLECADPLRGN